MAHHILKATKETVHLGGFSHLLKPALIVDSNDTIDLEIYTGYYVYDKAPQEFLTPEFLDKREYMECYLSQFYRK